MHTSKRQRCMHVTVPSPLLLLFVVFMIVILDEHVDIFLYPRRYSHACATALYYVSTIGSVNNKLLYSYFFKGCFLLWGFWE